MHILEHCVGKRTTVTGKKKMISVGKGGSLHFKNSKCTNEVIQNTFYQTGRDGASVVLATTTTINRRQLIRGPKYSSVSSIKKKKKKSSVSSIKEKKIKKYH